MTSRIASSSRTVGGGVSVIVIPDPVALNELLSGRSGDLKRVMAGFAGRATAKARQLAGERLKTRTGTYKRGIRASFPRPDEFRINADAPYSYQLELSTRPHPIVGNPLLAWPPDRSNTGRWVVTPAVQHPGNKGYNIVTDGVLQAAKEIGF